REPDARSKGERRRSRWPHFFLANRLVHRHTSLASRAHALAHPHGLTKEPAMSRHLAIVLLVLGLPATVGAQQAPEELLSADTQIYVRWDGVDAHRAAYDKTALGKIMQGDTGKFVSKTFAQVQDTLNAGLTVEQLLGGVPPEQLEKLTKDANKATKLLDLLGRHGFIVGVELRGLEPPQAQLTLVLPDAAADPEPLFAALRLGTGLAKVAVKQTKIAGREGA